MNKIIEGAKQALKFAKCDHHLVPVNPDVKDPSKFQRWYCDRCHAIIYTPVSNGHQAHD